MSLAIQKPSQHTAQARANRMTNLVHLDGLQLRRLQLFPRRKPMLMLNRLHSLGNILELTQPALERRQRRNGRLLVRVERGFGLFGICSESLLRWSGKSSARKRLMGCHAERRSGEIAEKDVQSSWSRP